MKLSELVEQINIRLTEPHSEMMMKWTRQRANGNHPTLTQAAEWAAETIAEYVEEILNTMPQNPRGKK